jgi:predicted transcriptional regulator
MKNLNTKLAEIILHQLSRQPLSRTELAKQTITRSGTPATFESTFSHLVKEGYAEKNSPKYRAKYILTDKGSALLKVLENPKH